MVRGNGVGFGQYEGFFEIKGYIFKLGLNSIMVCFFFVIVIFMGVDSICRKVDLIRFGVLLRENNEIRENKGKGVENVCKRVI